MFDIMRLIGPRTPRCALSALCFSGAMSRENSRGGQPWKYCLTDGESVPIYGMGVSHELRHQAVSSLGTFICNIGTEAGSACFCGQPSFTDPGASDADLLCRDEGPGPSTEPF